MENIVQTFHQFCPVFNQLVAAFAMRIVYRPGHRHHFAPHLRRQLGGNQRTGFQCRLNHQCQLRQRGNQTVAARKITCKRTRVQRELADNQSPFGNFISKFFIGRRINAVYTGSPDGNGTAICLQCALMCGSIDTRSHTRYDRNAFFAQRPAEIFGNPHCLRRGMAAANNRGRRCVQQLCIAA